MQAANKAPYLEMSRLGALAKFATSGNHIKRPKAASPSVTTEEGQFLEGPDGDVPGFGAFVTRWVPVFSFQFFSVFDSGHDASCELEANRDAGGVTIGSIDVQLRQQDGATVVEDGTVEVTVDGETKFGLQQIVVAIRCDVEISEVRFAKLNQVGDSFEIERASGWLESPQCRSTT